MYTHRYTHRYTHINIYIYIYNFYKCDIIYNYISVSVLKLNNKIVIGIYRYL